jgi:hypothetical protein
VPPGGSSPPKHLYQRHNSGAIFKYKGTPMSWQLVDGHPASAEIAADKAELYQRHKDGQIYQFTGSGWQEIGNNPESAQLSAGGGTLYLRLVAGRIFRYNGTPFTGWEMLDQNPETAFITAARGRGPLYQRHRGGAVWIFHDDPVPVG